MQLQNKSATIVLLAVIMATKTLGIPISQNDTSLDRRNDALIKTGYVAFNDSYAAGIGTGTTETGGFRRGQYS
jgi:hypothetical protein